jgi:hypothetical protein
VLSICTQVLAAPTKFVWDVTHVYGSAYIQTEARLTDWQHSYTDIDREPETGYNTWSTVGAHSELASSYIGSPEPGNSSEVYAAGSYQSVSTASSYNYNFGFLAKVNASGIINLDNPNPYYQAWALSMPKVYETGVMKPKNVVSGTTHYTVTAWVSITADGYAEGDNRIEGPRWVMVSFGEDSGDHYSFIWAQYDPADDEWSIWYQHCSLSGTQHIVYTDTDTIQGYANINNYGLYHIHRSAIADASSWTISVNSGVSSLVVFADNYYGETSAHQDVELGGKIDMIEVEPY